jgi:hypothetical protein
MTLGELHGHLRLNQVTHGLESKDFFFSNPTSRILAMDLFSDFPDQ